MSSYYGKNGVLRFYDSTKGRDLSQSAPIEVRIETEISASFADITANALNAASGTNAILAVAADRVYVGNLFPFSRVTIDLGTIGSADGGLLVVQYWNGTTWVAVPSLSDGTAVGGHTMRQDGVIQFDVPEDWAVNDPGAAGTSLYYIRFNSTTNMATDPVAELIEPSSGQYYELVFSQMNLVAPEGNNRPEEIVRMNRGHLDANAHYIQGLDEPILEAMPISLSALMDSIFNKTVLATVLACGNANLVTWPKTGISTKGDSSLPSGLTGTMVRTPLFTDPTKKIISIQGMWDDLTGNKVFREYNETYVPPSGVTLNEAPDSVILNISGGIFGAVRSDLTHFGYRW